MKSAVFSYLFLLCILSGLASTSLCAQSVTVRSSFDPSVITHGENAVYSIVVSGSRQKIEGSVPASSGIQLKYVGEQQFFHISNGRQESGVNYQFSVSVQGPGVYKVPDFQVRLGQQTYTVPAATLKVIKPEEQYAQGEGKAFWFEHETLDDQYYTGQSIPLTLKLYMRDGIRITGLTHPEKQGDAFSMIPFSDQYPTEHTEALNGVRYNVYHWQTAVTGLKNGLQDLQFSIRAQVIVPERSRRRRSPFDSPFGDIFGPRGKRLDINLDTQAHQLDIQSLPEQDKPDGFTGAIGTFSMDEIALSDKVANAGEPITLTVKIRGTGNFDRIQPPQLTSTDGWQTYDPEETFVVADQLGLSGTKTFAYTIIPTSKQVTQSPALSFAYFDPRSGQYVAYNAKSQAVEVIPAKSSTPIIIQQPSSPLSSATSNPQPQPKQLSLLPIQLEAGTWAHNLSPAFKSPGFLALQTVPLGTLLAIVFMRKRQLRLMHDDQYARKIKASKAVHSWLNQAKEASQASDASAFYAAATRTLQAFIGGITRQAPQSLTLAEIELHLVGCQAEPEDFVHIHEFFEANDALKFSGSTAPLHNASEQYEKLESLIRNLQKFT